MKQNKQTTWIKKCDPVLAAAWILAILSAFFTVPDKAYISYIDFRSLGILWSLMVIIQGFAENGVFERIAGRMLRKEKNGLQVAAILVFLCFFSGMLITNDVALLTFVPFAIMVLKNAGREDLTIRVVVLQTIAANLGSMLTPIGNPQNLYLYGVTGMNLKKFAGSMLPYTLLTAALLVILLLFLPDKTKKIKGAGSVSSPQKETRSVEVAAFGVLFILAILVVLRLLPWQVLLGITFALTMVLDAKILKRADYVLLLTFVGFFIFTGNIGRIPQVNRLLQGLIAGHEFYTAIGISQVISNVPATLLMIDFAKNPVELLRGVNVGGLGTLIASMASLISYKAFTNAYNEKKGRYLLSFTGLNLLFLAGMVLLHFISIP